jgi:lipopolysaccharide export LptBFGC system permease protein LptF
MKKLWRSHQLYRYLLKSIVSFHLLFSGLFIFLVLLSNIWYFAPEWLELGIGVNHILIMVSFFIPGALMQASAIALSLAFWVSYGRLQFYKEIDAMRSLGFSSFAIFKPLLDYAMILVVVIFFVGYIVYPYTMNAFTEYYAQVLTQHVAIRSQEKQAQRLGSSIIYMQQDGEKQHWLLIESRQGQKIFAWMEDTQLVSSGEWRFLNAHEVEMLILANNIASNQWHWLTAENFSYPLTFNIDNQGYNPYDSLSFSGLLGEWQRLLSERQLELTDRKHRASELKVLLNQRELPESDREIYRIELASLRESLSFSRDLVSLTFVTLLRFSHIILILGLSVLAFLMLELSQMRRWILALIFWLLAIVLYWALFYYISNEILSMYWHAYTILIPILLILTVDLILGIILAKNRGLLCKK